MKLTADVDYQTHYLQQGGPKVTSYQWFVTWDPYKWPKMNGKLGRKIASYRGPMSRTIYDW